MKQLLRFFVVLVMMFLSSVSVSAANWAYSIVFDGSPAKSYKLGNTSNGSDNLTWYVKVKGSDLATLDTDHDNMVTFSLTVKYTDSNPAVTYKLGPTTNNQLVAFGTDYTATSATQNSFKLDISGGKTPLSFYTFKYQTLGSDRNKAQLTVTFDEGKLYQISTDGDTWTTVNSGETIYNTDMPFYFSKFDGITRTCYKAVGDAKLESGTPKSIVAAMGEADRTLFTTDESSVYGFSFNFSETQLTIQDKGAANAYYLVSPELTDNKKLAAFRLIPSRERGGGALSDKLFSINMKDERIAKALDDYNTKHGTSLTAIHYHIVRGSDNTCFRPYAANYELGMAFPLYNTTNNNVLHQSYGDTKASGATSNEFLLKQGTGVSYTWLFDASGYAPLSINVNKSALKESTTKSYYAVGNYADADATVNIEPYETNSRAKMTRILYRKETPGIGFPDETTDFDATTMDSVVYRVTVPRPVKGWGELYMAVATGDLVEDNDARKWKGTPANNRWFKVIRPQVHATGSGTEGMDGTALEGGIFWSDVATNKSQALNPQVTSAYAAATSYTFSINLTTSTYRITFNTERMYIVGSAVADANAGAEEVNIAGIPTSKRKVRALPLTWDAEEQCFKYMVGNVEKPIVMNSSVNEGILKGNRFRFVYNKNFTKTWFGENGNNELVGNAVPADLTNSDKAYTANGSFFDTQYVNYVQAYRSPENKYIDFTKDIKFLLPEKSAGYIVRLYIKKIGDKVNYFYTINRKISFNQLDLEDENKLDGLKYYRAFSEWHACKLPDGVRMYIVTSTSAVNKTATLTELTGYNFIPARTGVILATNKAKKIDIETYAENPEATLADMGTSLNNLLVAQCDNVDIPTSTVIGGVAKYNYILGVYKKNTETSNHLGFYHPAPGVKSGRNYSFLQVTDNVALGAKGYHFYVGGHVVNGIYQPESPNGASTVTTSYYNLQGVQVPHPQVKGVYIHHGKKLIVR